MCAEFGRIHERRLRALAAMKLLHVRAVDDFRGLVVSGCTMARRHGRGRQQRRGRGDVEPGNPDSLGRRDLGQ